MLTKNPYEVFPFADWWGTLTTSFVSFYFIIFVFMVVLLYYMIPREKRWMVLLGASVLFYSIAGIHPLIMILLTSLLTYVSACFIECVNREKRKQRKIIFIITVISILLVLVFGKVYKLFDLEFHYIIPLGISYYTFSAIGYLADIYWGKEKAEKNFLKLALFLLYFPKILQGPISKHRDLGHQLTEGHEFRYQEFCFGIQLAIWGYFKKLIIADRAAVFTGTVFCNVDSFGGAMITIAALLSVAELYCDFSGCMDIAAGISQMFGIKLERNFDHPFCSKSVAEFWRRWHVTLGIWFKDYVYMPLAISPRLIRLSGKVGKKFGKRWGKSVMTVLPTAIVWMLTGLWHGTGVNYVVWGIYWGTIIIITTVFAPEIKKVNAILNINEKTDQWKVFQTIRTFILFIIGRLITIPGNLAVTGKLIRIVFTAPALWQLVDGTLYAQGLDEREFFFLLFMIGVLWLASLSEKTGSVREKIAEWNIALRCSFYALTVVFILVFGIYGPESGITSFVYANY